MTPKLKGTRGALSAAAAPGRQSTRIAAQMATAQQAAEQAATDITSPQPLDDTTAPSDSSMPPPSTAGRGRPSRGRGEQYARRGTKRPSQAPSMRPSIQSGQATSVVDYHSTQSDTRGEQRKHPLSLYHVPSLIITRTIHSSTCQPGQLGSL